MDTWQYFLHRLMHVNKYLYRKFHSVHHRLYVPYAYGALYNHWFEGLLLDTLGAAVSHLVSGMGLRQGIFLFAFSTLKTVDDHCGYALPFDPLQMAFGNNAPYHDVHHQASSRIHLIRKYTYPIYPVLRPQEELQPAVLCSLGHYPRNQDGAPPSLRQEGRSSQIKRKGALILAPILALDLGLVVIRVLRVYFSCCSDLCISLCVALSLSPYSPLFIYRLLVVLYTECLM